jgi:hypothetical protein
MCPFHESGKPALLLVYFSHGTWHCSSCGDGNMIEFHARLRGIDVNAAMYELILPWRDQE